MIGFNHKNGKHIEIDSAKIYFEEIGDPEKKPLLLLHGGFGNLEDFNNLIPLLNQEFRIIGIDSRGQGKSTLGKDHLTYERLQKDIEEVIKSMNLSDNLSVIGISDGGIAAYRLVCFSDIRISKLITIGSRWNYQNARDTREILTGITSSKWKERFPETYTAYKMLNPEPDFEKLTTSLVQMWIDEKESGYPNEKVMNIACSTLIVRGENDHLVKKKTVFDLSELIPDSHLAHIPFCGHLVYPEQTNILMTLINEFLH